MVAYFLITNFLITTKKSLTSSFKMNKIKTSYAFLVLFLVSMFFSHAVFSQFSIGTSYGIQIPGRQDLKFRYYENNVLLQELKTTYVYTTITPMFNLNATYWFKKYGIRFDYFAWEHISTAKRFETPGTPPFNGIEQGRDALFFSVLRKMPFPFISKEKQRNPNFFSSVGIGIGETLTEVKKGRTQWRAAFQLSYNLTVPIIKNVNGTLEFKYLLTRDIDTLFVNDGWFIDTSGRWTLFRFGPHWDTKYHVIQFGLQWDVFKKKTKK